MPRLRNISSETLKVGGWQVDQIGSGIPLDAHGSAQHRLYELAPGQDVEIDAQILNHPIIQNAVESGNFEILNVTLAPGGEVEADPAEPTGATKKLELLLTDAQLTDALASQSFGMGALPTGAHVLHAWAEITDVFDGGSISAANLELGSSGDPDAIGSTLNLFAATGLAEATLAGRQFPLGIDVVAKLTVTGDTVDNATSASAKIVLLYVVL